MLNKVIAVLATGLAAFAFTAGTANAIPQEGDVGLYRDIAFQDINHTHLSGADVPTSCASVPHAVQSADNLSGIDSTNVGADAKVLEFHAVPAGGTCSELTLVAVVTPGSAVSFPADPVRGGVTHWFGTSL